MPRRAHCLGASDPPRQRAAAAPATCAPGPLRADRVARRRGSAILDRPRPAANLRPARRARRRTAAYAQHGAPFFEESLTRPACCARKSKRRSAELVALGMVNSDSFGGLSALLVPWTGAGQSRGAKRRRRMLSLRHGRRGGRWAWRAVQRRQNDEAREAPRSNTGPRAAAPLRRRVFPPAGREAGGCRLGAILRVYRRSEARGEIRGGRFVAGFSGEQYALPEASANCARCGAGPPSNGFRCRGPIRSISPAS